MDLANILAQQDELKRRRGRLDADQKFITDTRGAESTNLLDVLSAAVRGHRSKDAEASYTRDALANRQAYSGQLQTEFGQYLDTAEGRPANAPADGVGPTLPGEAPNQRKAVMQALVSQMPEMQAMGKAGMGSLQKSQLNPLDILKLDTSFTPESRRAAAMAGDISLLKRTQKNTVINGQLVQEPGESEGAPKTLGDFRDTFNAPGSIGTDPTTGRPVFGQFEKGTGKATALGGGGTTVNIDNVGNKEALGAAGKVMEGARNGMLSAQKEFATSERLYALAKDPATITGFGAGVGLGLASLGAKLGFSGADAATKTQAALAEMAIRTLAAGQDMKGAFSDNDIKFLKEVTSGDITFTAANIQRAASLGMVAAHNTMMNSSEQLSSARGVPGAESIAQLYPTPGFSNKFPEDPSFVHDDRTGRVSFADIAKPKPSPLSQDGYTRLPSGALYEAPDGTWRTKR